MSNTLLNDILSFWSETIEPNKITLNDLSEKYITSIYSLISSAEREYKKINKNKDFIRVNMKKFNKNDLLNLSLYHSNYFPYYIKEKTMKETKYVTQITMKLNMFQDKKIQVKIYSKTQIREIKLERYIKYIFTILHILYSQQKHNCGNELNIHIVLSNEKKKLPQNNTVVLDSKHVNSALTTGCTPNGEVLIFRCEEWTKTLIHELFHVLGLDFSSYFLSSKKDELRKLFYVDSTYKIYETYSELMATILHVCMISYKLLTPINKQHRENQEIISQYLFYTETLLTYELYFSFFQSMKIMRFMNISYDMFHKAKINKLYRKQLNTAYKEKTNVFCYYILKLPLLLNINSFISWISSNNRTLFQFKNTETNIDNFIHFLDRIYYDKNNQYKKKMFSKYEQNYESKREDKKYIEIMNTMRMTINDYF
jgi:hypothetical protein